MFFALHPLIIANYSVTFASPAILYCIISLFLVARAIDVKNRSGRIGLLFGSGIAMGAALHVHLGIVVYGIANYLIYLVYELLYSPEAIRTRIWHLLQAGCVVLAGIAGLTVALGGLAMLFGGSFSLVFEQFRDLSYELSSAARQEWSVPDWYLHGGTIGMFVAALLLSAINIYLCSSRLGRVTLPENVRQRVSALSWAMLALTVIGLPYSAFDGSIGYDYYYVFFVPYLGVVVFSPLLFLNIGKSRATIAWAIVFLICGLGASALNEHVIGWLHRVPIEAIASLAAAVCAGSVYGYLALSGRTGPGLGVLYAVLILFMLIIVRPEQMGVQIWNSPRDLQYAREYQRIREGLGLLSTVHFKRYPQFWIDTSGPNELIAYPRSYLFCRFQKPFPAIDRDLWNVKKNGPVAPFQFTPDQDVVIISSAPNLRLTADAAFAALGLVADELADFTLRSRGKDYEFLIEHISATTAVSSPPADSEQFNNVFRPVALTGITSIENNAFPIEVRTPAQPWEYGARFQPAREKLEGPLWIRVRADVRNGPVGVGILNRVATNFISRRLVTDPGPVTIDFHIVDPELAGDLVVESWDKGKPADVTISDITVLRPRAPVETATPTRKPDTLLFNLPVAHLEPANGASVSSVNDGLQLVTAAPRSYSLTGSLRTEPASGPAIVRLRLQVKEGEVGVAISASGNISSLIRRVDGVKASTGPEEVDLDIPDIDAAGLLIIQNESLNGPSRVVVHSIDVLRAN